MGSASFWAIVLHTQMVILMAHYLSVFFFRVLRTLGGPLKKKKKTDLLHNEEETNPIPRSVFTNFPIRNLLLF
jgi:hypothetical protein